MTTETGVVVDGVCGFHSFYRDQVRGVTALAVALTADRQVAEDLAQEAFARAYRDWDRVRTYDDPGAWVRKVVANLSRSRWRRLRSERRALARLHSPDERVDGLQTGSAELWRAVRRLPRQQAIAIALRYVDDLSVADIAAFLGVSEGTAKSHLHRGRKRLAEMLDQEALR